MKKTIMKRWVKALRSGKYEQRHGVLCADGKHCCLGVLCDLAAKAKVCTPYPLSHSVITYDDRTFDVPESVRKWAGMKSNNGRYRQDVSSLADQNDDGRSFKQIAATIERNVDRL